VSKHNGDPVLSKPRAKPSKAPSKPRAKPAPKAKQPVGPINTGHGRLSINLGWLFANRHVAITGGPYDQYTPTNGSFGVCVRAERIPQDKVDVVLPIQDFQVPADGAAVAVAIKGALEAALTGKDVYVGCMGGYGRTGLFLALIAKAAGVSRPIAFVRRNYCSHAVETRDQANYIRRFNVLPLRWWLLKRCWSLWWQGLVA